jgi:hypothetical protein
MRERERDPYWQDDVAIGEAALFSDASYAIRMRLHTETERVTSRRELVPVTQPAERVYLHGKPYILVPDITLTVQLHPEPDPAGAIGTVTGSEWLGMRHEDIGQAQAWFYPADRLLVLWECFPEERYRTSDDPREDRTLHALWTGFEALLRNRFPDSAHVVTTWEDVYDRPSWQAFVEQRGFRPVAPAAFVKDLTPPAEPTT